MTINKDKATTVLGGLGALVTAAAPVINASNGRLDNQGILQLIMAVVFGLFGWYTNKSQDTNKA